MKKEMKTVLEHSYKGKEIIEYIEELEASETSLGNDLQEALDRWNKWRNKCLKFEKALDKACDRLDFFDHLYGDDEYEDWKTKEQWKEWCLKDD